MTSEDEQYRKRRWCARHGDVSVERETCPECGHLLLTKGAYRASFGHGNRSYHT